MPNAMMITAIAAILMTEYFVFLQRSDNSNVQGIFTQFSTICFSLSEINRASCSLGKSFLLKNHHIRQLIIFVIPGEPYKFKSTVNDIRDLLFDG